jgi:hypothetical protein
MECSHLTSIFRLSVAFIYRMAQAVAFQAALQCFGFNAQAIAALNANGLQNVHDLVNLSEKDTTQILRIVCTGPPPLVVPYLAQKRLNIFCFWATRRDQLYEALLPNLFDQAALEYLWRYDGYISTRGRACSQATKQIQERYKVEEL